MLAIACLGVNREKRSAASLKEGLMNTMLRRVAIAVGVGLSVATAPLLFGGLTASAATGTVLADFVPGGATGNGRGVAFDGTNLYYTIVDDANIYKVTTSGALLATIPVAGGVSKGGPLAWDGSALWTMNYAVNSFTLFRVNPTTGSILSSCNIATQNPSDPAVTSSPRNIGESPDGLDWTAGTLWVSSEIFPGNWVVNVDTSCKILSEFNPPANQGATPGGDGGTSGVAFDGVNLWHPTRNSPTNMLIFQTTTSGALTGVNFVTGANQLTEDLTFDRVTFAPKCALWGDSATATGTPNHLTAYEIPCPEFPIAATGTNISATEGKSFSGPVATFTDPDPNATASEYSATIDWGDGSSSPADGQAVTVSGPTGGPFAVNGTHTYAQEGTDTVTVTITDVDTPSNTATTTSMATVGDAALAATCAAPAVSPMSFTGPTANLTDANSFGTTSDFIATISWGDASSSFGTVTGPMGGPFVVSGSHTYAAPGPYTITTAINDDGGSTATTSCQVTVFATLATGNFVIGDGNSAVGTAVTFWGAQWAKRNTLSGGQAPASFKGFEDTPPASACGTTWSTDPGNSTPPPAGPLPTFMAVIVSSSISKSGSTISGDTVHIVIVKTNPGYQPNPGHAGTGTVVAQVC